jgi:AcrR family transcriptional regulator
LSIKARKRGETTVAKERLSREVIVSRAIALADAEGLEAVTIRRLAQDQGVTPMALYWHFRDKELLLDGVVERLLNEVQLPDPDPARPWDEELRGVLIALLDMLRAHPGIAQLMHTRFIGSEAGLDISERSFGLLREAGFDASVACQLGMHALFSLTLMVIAEPGKPLPGEDVELTQQRIRTKKVTLQALSPEKYPNVRACAEPMTSTVSEAAYFDLGVDLLIAGLRGIQPALTA